MTRFDEDIALVPDGKHSYLVAISDNWQVNVGPNGGYVGAIMLAGMKRQLEPKEARTRSVTCHFLSASAPGEARLDVTVEKLGRSLSTATARLVQGDRTIAFALATFGARRDAVEFCDIRPPGVEPADRIDPAHIMRQGMAAHAPFRDNYEQRLAIGLLPPGAGSRGRVGGWTRFRERRPFDDLAMVAIADSWYPSFMARPMPRAMHAPTVDYTVHIMKDLPLANVRPDEFILAEFETNVAADGYLIEDGRLWSPDGNLMAVSRQLAVLLQRDTD